MRGKFITIEGSDGCGKTTQIEYIQKYLHDLNREVLISIEPGGTVIADKIRDILLDPEHKELNERTELLLYLASRAQHTQEVILPALEKGVDVICSRYYDATFAYQGYARGLDLDFVALSNAFATFGLKPDLTIIIDIDPAYGIARAQETSKKHNKGQGDRMEQQKKEFYQKVRFGYQQIAANEPDRVKMIPYQQGAENVFQTIRELLSEQLAT